MPELNPPELMPRGNVGTPTLQFLDLIQKCLLPRNLVQKLKLKFPSTSGSRLYSNVSLDYKTKSFPNTTSVSSPARNLHNSKSLSTKKLSNSSRLTSDVPEKGSFDHSTTSSDDHSQTSSPCDNSLTTPNNKTCLAGNTDSTDRHVCQSGQSNSGKDTNNTQTDNERPPQNDLPAEKSDNSEFLMPQELTKRELKRIKREEKKRIRKLMDEGIEERLIAIDKKYRVST